MFVSGGLSGIFLGTSAADIQLQDTYFVVAHFHLVMAIAPLFAAIWGRRRAMMAAALRAASVRSSYDFSRITKNA